MDNENTENLSLREQEWIQLEPHGREFSRMLYTNPVCFLTTTDINNGKLFRNVMTVSWLSAVNNNGRFMMSINSKRHTASVLTNQSGAVFVLCVPVKGMEELVIQVGKTSGKWKSSKFPQDHISTVEESEVSLAIDCNKRIKYRHGIEGLVATKIGTSQVIEKDAEIPFAIQGTVAHLVCKVDNILDPESKFIDDQHYLIMADILEAYVAKEYWDTKRKVFRPSEMSSPYLTFFGSQLLGYVTCYP